MMAKEAADELQARIRELEIRLSVVEPRMVEAEKLLGVAQQSEMGGAREAEAGAGGESAG